MNIAGHATAKGTDEYCRRFLDRFDQGHFHSVEKLRWSSIGLGTYLGKPDTKTDKLVAKAVIQSIEGGINVIDTAINYRRQHGEKSIGAALRNIVPKGKYNISKGSTDTFFSMLSPIVDSSVDHVNPAFDRLNNRLCNELICFGIGFA
jgi:aryl-alcohol dehydrogenase-like predicted oxidoreductase